MDAGVLVGIAAALLAAALPVLVFALVPASPAAAGRSSAAPGAPGAAAPAPRALTWIAPRGMRARLERAIQLAALSSTWSLARALRAKALLALVGLVVGAGLVAASPGPVTVVLGVALVAIGYLVPDALLAARARERQERIQDALPDSLDQVTIAIEAGLGLETAVARAGQFGTGPLAEELTRTIQDMRVGYSRREAWTALAARTDVADLRRFARAIMQADQYGVSIGNVVRSQAKELRARRRQRAEERAMKVPVKILFPLMFSILPVLFIVVLGPAAINLLRVVATIG